MRIKRILFIAMMSLVLTGCRTYKFKDVGADSTTPSISQDATVGADEGVTTPTTTLAVEQTTKATEKATTAKATEVVTTTEATEKTTAVTTKTTEKVTTAKATEVATTTKATETVTPPTVEYVVDDCVRDIHAGFNARLSELGEGKATLSEDMGRIAKGYTEQMAALGCVIPVKLEGYTCISSEMTGKNLADYIGRYFADGGLRGSEVGIAYSEGVGVYYVCIIVR